MNVKNINIKDFLQALFSLYLLILGTGYFILGNNEFFDGYTFLNGAFLALIFMISLKCAKHDLFPHVAMVCIISLLYIFPRILTFLYIPGIVAFPFGWAIGVSVINQGLIFVVLGTASLMAGIFIAAFFLARKSSGLPDGNAVAIGSPLIGMVSIFILEMAIELFITMGLEISPYGKLRAENWNTQLQIIRGLFAVDTFFFILLCIFIFEKKITSKKWWIFVIAVYLFYAAYTAMTGSRGVGIRSLFMVFAIFLACMENFKPRITICLLIFSVIAATSILSYPVASAKRLNIVQEYNNGFPVMNPAKIRESETRKIIKSADSQWVANSVATILNRLAIVDYAILIKTQPGNSEAMKKYMNVPYVVKSILNTALPGTPFPEAELSTSRVINIIYREYEEKYVLKSGYFSEHWTIWGLAFIFFGYQGGLFALLLLGFSLHMLYSGGAKFFGAYRFYYKALFLFLVIPLTYISMGIDHSFAAISVITLQAVVVLILLRSFNWLFLAMHRN